MIGPLFFAPLVGAGIVIGLSLALPSLAAAYATAILAGSDRAEAIALMSAGGAASAIQVGVAIAFAAALALVLPAITRPILNIAGNVAARRAGRYLRPDRDFWPSASAIGWFGSLLAFAVSLATCLVAWPAPDLDALDAITRGGGGPADWVRLLTPAATRTVIAALVGVIGGTFWQAMLGSDDASAEPGSIR